MRFFSTFILLLLLFSIDNGTLAQANLDRDRLASEMESLINRGCLDNWYPRSVDKENGGFLSDFDSEWKLSGAQNKMIVTQSRHVWSLAIAAEFYPDRDYLKLARHGFEFLRDKMWDHDHGGFYQSVDQKGNPIQPDATDGFIKTAYGNAFGIYGLSAYYRASKDEEALVLAKQAFAWLDEHSHDPSLGGYFQFLAQDGTPFREGREAPPKDQNSSIHLLEAFTELYMVWPDETVRKRVEEMLLLIRDVITTEKGYLTLFSQADWTPVSYQDSSAEVRDAHHNLDHVSFGHDIETAYLLMEASHVIHHEEHSLTKKKAKIMVDHTLNFGWDEETGGIYDGGYYFDKDQPLKIINEGKAWWAQVEAMNTLLIMADDYPQDDIPYAELFLKQWDYVQKYLVDTEHGGFYIEGIDEDPEAVHARKGSIWKGNYHNLRSLVNCVKRLRNE